MNQFFRISKIVVIMIILTVTAASASQSVFIGRFETPEKQTEKAFTDVLYTALQNHGFTCVSNSTKDEEFSRYKVDGVLEISGNDTSYSAILSDKFNLEPTVFFKGTQKGGSDLTPAANKLAESIYSRLQSNVISGIEVKGNFRLTPGAIIALAEVHPGDEININSIVAARTILENCGLFNSVRIFFEPTEDGKILHIMIGEGPMLSGRGLDGTGIEQIKTEILKSSRKPLPSFRVFTSSSNSTCLTGKTMFEAGELVTDFEQSNDEQELVEILTDIINTAEIIRQDVASYSPEERCNSIVLLKLCSILTSDKVFSLDRYFRRLLRQAHSQDEVERIVNTTGLIARASETAASLEEIIGSRLFLEKPHAPNSPMILQLMGDLASNRGDNELARGLYQMAVKASGLPVSSHLLTSLAESRYRELDRDAGDMVLEKLKPLLSPDVNLSSDDKAGIEDLQLLSTLCRTVENIDDEANFKSLLIKGHALISLRRPDLAEPLFHHLHGMEPDDARPFTGFARLAVQRSGKMSSAKTYLEKSRNMKNKDQHYYELALGYVLDRIVNEALPDLEASGKESEQATAVLYLLPNAFSYINGYEKINPGTAYAVENGLTTFKKWLNYPEISANEAFEDLLFQTEELRKKYPESSDCAAAALFSSILADSGRKNQEDYERLRSAALNQIPEDADQHLKLLRLNILIHGMNYYPDGNQVEAIKKSFQSIAPDYSNRKHSITVQADSMAITGLYLKKASLLNRSKSLYLIAQNENEAAEQSRILNNIAVIDVLTGHGDAAEDLLNEAIDLASTDSETAKVNRDIIHKRQELQRKAKFMGNATSHDTTAGIKANAIGSEVNVPDKDPAGYYGKFARLEEKASFNPEYDPFGRLKLTFDYEASPWFSLERIFAQKNYMKKNLQPQK